MFADLYGHVTGHSEPEIAVQTCPHAPQPPTPGIFTWSAGRHDDQEGPVTGEKQFSANVSSLVSYLVSQSVS